MKKALLVASFCMAVGSIGDAAPAAPGGSSRFGAVTVEWRATLRATPALARLDVHPLSLAPMVAALEKRGLTAGSFAAARAGLIEDALEEARRSVRSQAVTARDAVEENERLLMRTGEFDDMMGQELSSAVSELMEIRDLYPKYLGRGMLRSVQAAHSAASDILARNVIRHAGRIAEELGVARDAAGAPGTGAQAGQVPLAPAAEKAAAPASGGVPPAGEAVKAEKGPDGWQTLTDVLLIGGAAAAGYNEFNANPAISAYAAAVLVSTVRYSRDFVELANKKEWGGATKLAAGTFMAAVLAPVALAIDGFQTSGVKGFIAGLGQVLASPEEGPGGEKTLVTLQPAAPRPGESEASFVKFEPGNFYPMHDWDSSIEVLIGHRNSAVSTGVGYDSTKGSSTYGRFIYRDYIPGSEPTAFRALTTKQLADLRAAFSYWLGRRALNQEEFEAWQQFLRRIDESLSITAPSGLGKFSAAGTTVKA